MKIYRVTYQQNNEFKSEHTMAYNIYQVLTRFTRPLDEGREIVELTLVCETDEHGDSIYLKG